MRSEIFPQHPDALALLVSARIEPKDPLARHILADWLTENGYSVLCHLIKKSLYSAGKIQNVSAKMADCVTGIRHGLDGWFLAGNHEAQGLAKGKVHGFSQWISGLHLSGQGLNEADQIKLLQLVPKIWNRSWRVLSLANFNVEPRAFIEILDPAWADQISHLRLGGPLCSPEIIQNIGHWAPDLHTLELRSQHWRPDQPESGSFRKTIDKPPAFFWHGPRVKLPGKLGCLRLENYSMTPLALSEFLNTISVLTLSGLELNQCHLGHGAFFVFNHAPIWNSLEHLRLIGCCLSAGGKTEGASKTTPIPINKLKSLTLRACGIQADIARKISEAGWLAGPTCLNLSQNKFDSLAGLFDHHKASICQVESLELTYCGITCEQLQAWLNIESWERLRNLNLAGNALGNNGVALLSTAKNLPCLNTLNLYETSINGESISHLANGNLLQHLDKLVLNNNCLSDKEGWQKKLETLLCSPAVTNLRQLRFDAKDDWIQKNISSPECRLNQFALKDLSNLIKQRAESSKSHESGLSENAKNRQPRPSSSPAGIFGRWAAHLQRQRDQPAFETENREGDQPPPPI